MAKRNAPETGLDNLYTISTSNLARLLGGGMLRLQELHGKEEQDQGAKKIRGYF